MEILKANHLIIGSESIKEKKLGKVQIKPILVSANHVKINIAGTQIAPT